MLWDDKIKIQYLDNKILDRECENNQGIIDETSEFKYSSVEDTKQVKFNNRVLDSLGKKIYE